MIQCCIALSFSYSSFAMISQLDHSKHLIGNMIGNMIDANYLGSRVLAKTAVPVQRRRHSVARLCWNRTDHEGLVTWPIFFSYCRAKCSLLVFSQVRAADVTGIFS